MRAYRKIAEIHLKHSYYTKGIVSADDFSFFKTPETEKLLANYHLIVKFKPGRIELIQECEMDDGVLEPFIEIDHEFKLGIVVQLRNKQLFSFSELPFIERNKELFYFSNKKGGTLNYEGSLTQDEYVGQKDTVLLFPKSANKIAALTWQKKKQLLSADHSIKIDIETPEQLAEQLAKLKDGAYTLRTGNLTDLSFCMLKNKYSVSDIALIEFVVDPKMAKSVNSSPSQFSIGFDVRKLQWQYQVFERFNSIKNILIVDDKSEVTFKEQRQVEVNGMQAKVFISEQALPLKEITKQSFRIVSPNNGRAGKVWVEKLPIPKLTNLAKASENDNIMVFKEYVYL